MVLIIIFLTVGYLSAAFMEYMLHRYYLHLPTHSHTTHHHKIFRYDYEDTSQTAKDIVSAPAYIFASSLLALTLTIFFMVLQPTTAYLIYLSALVYLIGLEYLHFLFHSPKKIWIEKMVLFLLLKEHHHLHHIHFNINYGIGSTLYDYILRTKLK